MNPTTPEAILAVAECDVVFGCMDGTEGRHILNRIATFYSIRYFDVGVRLDADGQGGISAISGAVHYLQPGLSSLLSRGVYSIDQVEAAGIRRTSPKFYRQQHAEGYLRGSPYSLPFDMEDHRMPLTFPAQERKGAGGRVNLVELGCSCRLKIVYTQQRRPIPARTRQTGTANRPSASQVY